MQGEIQAGGTLIDPAARPLPMHVISRFGPCLPTIFPVIIRVLPFKQGKLLIYVLSILN